MSEPFPARALPDPLRAHGAWVFLFAAVGAGALCSSARGPVTALCVGTGFAGGYVGVAALAVGMRRRRRQLLLGLALAVLAPLAALGLGAERAFLAVAALGALAGAITLVLARHRGLLSAATLATGIAALVLAAPSAALAGGAGMGSSALLFALLWTFFLWRSHRVARSLEGASTWDRDELRSRGLREAAFAALWTLAVVAGLRLI